LISRSNGCKITYAGLVRRAGSDARASQRSSVMTSQRRQCTGVPRGGDALAHLVASAMLRDSKNSVTHGAAPCLHASGNLSWSASDVPL
jgi:hypothetical protein